MNFYKGTPWNFWDRVQYNRIMKKINDAKQNGKNCIQPIYDFRHNVRVRLEKEGFHVRISGTYKDPYFRIEW